MCSQRRDEIGQLAQAENLGLAAPENAQNFCYRTKCNIAVQKVKFFFVGPGQFLGSTMIDSAVGRRPIAVGNTVLPKNLREGAALETLILPAVGA